MGETRKLSFGSSVPLGSNHPIGQKLQKTYLQQNFILQSIEYVLAKDPRLRSTLHDLNASFSQTGHVFRAFEFLNPQEQRKINDALKPFSIHKLCKIAEQNDPSRFWDSFTEFNRELFESKNDTLIEWFMHNKSLMDQADLQREFSPYPRHLRKMNYWKELILGQGKVSISYLISQTTKDILNPSVLLPLLAAGSLGRLVQIKTFKRTQNLFGSLPYSGRVFSAFTGLTTEAATYTLSNRILQRFSDQNSQLTPLREFSSHFVAFAIFRLGAGLSYLHKGLQSSFLRFPSQIFFQYISLNLAHKTGVYLGFNPDLQVPWIQNILELSQLHFGLGLGHQLLSSPLKNDWRVHQDQRPRWQAPAKPRRVWQNLRRSKSLLSFKKAPKKDNISKPLTRGENPIASDRFKNIQKFLPPFNRDIEYYLGAGRNSLSETHVYLAMSGRAVVPNQAKIVFRNRGWRLFDGNSRYPVKHNGCSVDPRNSDGILLRNGDEIALGENRYRVHLDFSELRVEFLESKVPHDQMTLELKGSLHRTTSDWAHQLENLQVNRQAYYLIGHRSGGDLDMAVDNKTVSPAHFMIGGYDGHWYVNDLFSAYGTRIISDRIYQQYRQTAIDLRDFNRIEAHSAHRLNDGDIIFAGTQAFVFRIESHESARLIRKDNVALDLEAWARIISDYHGSRPTLESESYFGARKISHVELDHLKHYRDNSVLRSIVHHESSMIPRVKLKVGDYDFFLSDIHIDQSGRKYLVAIVPVIEGELTVLKPTYIYTSGSGGSWRCSTKAYGTWISKGIGRHYTQETQPAEALLKFLESPLKDQFLHQIEMWDNVVLETFNVAREGIGDRTKVILNETFAESVNFYDDQGDLYKVQAYQPGTMFQGEGASFYSYASGPSMELLHDAVASLPRGFVPDFKKAIRKYEYYHSELGLCDMYIFEAQLHGRTVHWGIAERVDSRNQERKNFGSAWVEFIRFADSRPNYHGTYSELIDSGMITNKPLEYTSQLSFALDKPGMREHIKAWNRHYQDIRPLIGRFSFMQSFYKNFTGTLQP